MAKYLCDQPKDSFFAGDKDDWSKRVTATFTDQVSGEVKVATMRLYYGNGVYVGRDWIISYDKDTNEVTEFVNFDDVIYSD